jgi:hypothetical protein
MERKATFNEFLVFCGRSLDHMSFSRLNAFCEAQWPIVERALFNGEGTRGCDSRAHDLTCSFVERKVSANLYE